MGWCWLWFVLGTLLAETVNPFEINFPNKNELTNEDYQGIQEQLRAKNLGDLIEALYPARWFYTKADFLCRCSRFLRHTIIDEKQGLFPQVQCLPGEDTECCVVLGCSLDGVYPQMLQSLIGALREIGFKGGIYYRIGGIANPTGEEARYVGVPYAFKLFLLEEARRLGYRYVLWLDAAVWPLNNLKQCFQWIREDGYLFEVSRPNVHFALPATQRILERFCNIQLKEVMHCAGWLMGFDMQAPFIQPFFADYRELVRQGTPFLSVTPEELVISALMAKHQLIPKKHSHLMLMGNAQDSKLVEAKRQGVHFLIRCH